MTKTSTVTVQNPNATHGYTLTARIAQNTLAGATVTIGSGSSALCTLASPCTLSSAMMNIMSTSNNSAVAGDTTNWTVTITIPAFTAQDTYILDIEYDEAAIPSVTITAPTAGQVLDFDTTSTTLSVTTHINATCRYGTANAAYASLPNTFTTTGATSHSQSITGLTNGGSYTYFVACDSGGGGTSATASRAFSVSNTPPPIPLMQDFTLTQCNALSSGQTINLRDQRDDTVYRVKKMIDGRCWMVDNLALDLTATYVGEPSWGTAPVLVSGSTSSVNNVPQLALNNNTVGEGQIPNNGSPKASYLYNWCAAMQDTTAGCATTVGYAAGQPAAAQTGICPAPFRLPIGGAAPTTSGNADTTTNEFSKLDIAMGGTGMNRTSANTYNAWTGTGTINTNWLGVPSGRYYSGLSTQGADGYWWSSRAFSGTNAQYLSLSQTNTNVYPANTLNKRYGFAVRCVLN